MSIFPTETTQIAAGAAAVKALVFEIWSISERTIWSLNDPDSDDSLDARDYPQMVSAIESALAGLGDAPSAYRQGALRALVDVLANWADNTCGVGRDWDPLQASEAAFVRARVGSSLRTA